MENAVKVIQSVSLFTIDHYMSNPVEGLDSLYSEFWGTQVVKVPILRVFGSTLEGNNVDKTCKYKNMCHIVVVMALRLQWCVFNSGLMKMC